MSDKPNTIENQNAHDSELIRPSCYVTVPIDLFESLIENTRHLLAEHYWWKDEQRCSYQSDYQTWCDEIEAAEKILLHNAELHSPLCSGLDCTMHRLQAESAQRRVVQKNTIANLLITHDIIHALSIEDAEGYDNFETTDNVSRFVQALESLLFPNTQVRDATNE